MWGDDIFRQGMNQPVSKTVEMREERKVDFLKGKFFIDSNKTTIKFSSGTATSHYADKHKYSFATEKNHESNCVTTITSFVDITSKLKQGLHIKTTADIEGSMKLIQNPCYVLLAITKNALEAYLPEQTPTV
jgi:hypothetical protein